MVEEIDRARPTLMLALEALGTRHNPEARRMRAAVLHTLAQVSARQGRVDEMERWLSQAEQELPGQPAYAWTRGNALAAVFRHGEAVSWLRVAAGSAPLDDRGWTQLAIAQGSLALHEQALASAVRALEINPRQPDALRVQALARLGAPEAVQRTALEAFLTHRRPDDAPGLRAACSSHVAGCALERTPAHRHPVLPTSSRRPR
jgi:tetratricopeptide (TPR) repeat protein